VRYSRVDFDIDIDEHPLASQLPKATDDPSIHPGPPHFLPLAVGPGVPKTIDDYLRSDEPQLTLHIVTFTDATLVTLVWPHTLSDCMGMQGLVTAWHLVLQGRETDVPPLKGIHEHPLASVGVKEPYESTNLPRLQGLPMVGFLIRYFWERWLQPELTIRTIYIPPRTVATLKNDTISQLARSQSPNSRDLVLDYGRVKDSVPLPFLSDGDILTSWIARASYRALVPHGSIRTLAIMNLFDARGRAPGAFDPNSACLVNASFATFANVPPSQARHLPGIAAIVRSAVAKQTTPPQVDMAVRELRNSLGSIWPLLFWPADSFMFVMSNWSRARFFETVDFSSAAAAREDVKKVEQDLGARSRSGGYGGGRPVFAHAQLLVPEKAARQSFQIMGRDTAGGYWMFGNLPTAAWKRIEEEVEALKTVVTNDSNIS
jgi:hypothetical protein